MDMLHVLAFGWAPSPFELIVILVVALLLFGKRLPDVARSLGKGIVEFKKGVKGIEQEVENAQYEPPKPQIHSSEVQSSENSSEKTDTVGGGAS